jgi:hypothetical protein
MTIVARRIASVPRRSSVGTWERIAELVTAEGSAARTELESATSIAGMLIAEEYSKDSPITVSGGGPFLRIYTLHGQEAIEHDLNDEAEIAFDPTSGDSWRLSVPALGTDLAIATKQLAGCAHIEVRDAAQTEVAEAAPADAKSLMIDLSAFERP